MRRRTPLTVITVLTALLSACGQPQTPQGVQATSGKGKVTVSIVPVLKAERLAPQSTGTTSPEVTEVQFPSGSMEFFEQELVVRVTDEAAFQSFLTKYNGVVVHDGALPAPPSASLKTRVVPDRQWRLVRVKAPMVSLEELAQELAAQGMQGDIRIPIRKPRTSTRWPWTTRTRTG